MGIALDPSDRFLYVANSCYLNSGGNCPGTVDGYDVNHGMPSAFTSGFSTDVSGAYPMLLTIDPTGRFLYSSEFAGSLVDAFAIDPNQGTLALAGTAATGTNPWTIMVGRPGATSTSRIMAMAVRPTKVPSRSLRSMPQTAP